jgi:hypothetical protein
MIFFTERVTATRTKDDQNPVKKWVAQAREQYEQLPDEGKFSTGAFVGFGASKMVVKSGE